MSELLKAMLAVKVALAKYGGITKDKRAPDQIGGYAFRGIDDADNVLCMLTAEHGLMAFPIVKTCRSETQQVGSKLQRHVQVELLVQWHHVSQEGGVFLETVTWGEGIDNGDKGTGKAFSNARKQAMFSVFMIPTHGENIEEHVTQIAPPATEPAPVPKREPKKAQPQPTNGKDIAPAINRIEQTNTFPALMAFLGEYAGDPPIMQAIKTRALALFGKADSMETVKAGLALYKAMGEDDDLAAAGNEAYARVRS